MATSSEPIDVSGRKVGGNRSVVVVVSSCRPQPHGLIVLTLNQTGRNPAKKPKVNLEDLCPTDEPLIFRFGGKLMRQYLNDSGLDGEEKDYDIRAICKNLVTNGTFQRAFQAARAGIFAKSPRWLQGAMRQQTPMKGHCIPYSPSTVNIIKVMQQAGTGLLILFSMDSSPTE